MVILVLAATPVLVGILYKYGNYSSFAVVFLIFGVLYVRRRRTLMNKKWEMEYNQRENLRCRDYFDEPLKTTSSPLSPKMNSQINELKLLNTLNSEHSTRMSETARQLSLGQFPWLNKAGGSPVPRLSPRPIKTPVKVRIAPPNTSSSLGLSLSDSISLSDASLREESSRNVLSALRAFSRKRHVLSYSEEENGTDEQSTSPKLSKVSLDHTRSPGTEESVSAIDTEDHHDTRKRDRDVDLLPLHVQNSRKRVKTSQTTWKRTNNEILASLSSSVGLLQPEIEKPRERIPENSTVRKPKRRSIQIQTAEDVTDANPREKQPKLVNMCVGTDPCQEYKILERPVVTPEVAQAHLDSFLAKTKNYVAPPEDLPSTTTLPIPPKETPSVQPPLVNPVLSFQPLKPIQAVKAPEVIPVLEVTKEVKPPEPKPPETPAFSFGVPKSNLTPGITKPDEIKATGFTFGAEQGKKTEAPPTFLQGNSQAKESPKSGTSFPIQTGFQLGAKSDDKKSEGFNLGGSTSAPSFSFGAPATTTTSVPTTTVSTTATSISMPTTTVPASTSAIGGFAFPAATFKPVTATSAPTATTAASAFSLGKSEPFKFGSAPTTTATFSAVTTTASSLGSSLTSSVTPFGTTATASSASLGGSLTSSVTPFGTAVTTSATLLGGSLTTSATPFGSAVTTSATPFGGAVTTSAVSLGASATPFGCTVTTAPSFGGPVTTSANLFGGTVTTSATSFGGAVTTSVMSFGGAVTTPSFGGSLFGGLSTSSFGNATTSSSLFSGSTTSTIAPFGSTTTKTSSPFGNVGTTTITPFASTATPPTTTPFGSAGTVGAFGNKVTSTTTTPFGSSTGTATTIAFGNPTPSTTQFNSGTSSFAPAAVPQFGNPAPSQTPSLFGGAVASPSPFGSTTNTAFGATAPSFGTSTPAFGATQFGAATTTSFTAQPQFTAAAPQFGSTSTPAFGASATPTFGATQPQSQFGSFSGFTPSQSQFNFTASAPAQPAQPSFPFSAQPASQPTQQPSMFQFGASGQQQAFTFNAGAPSATPGFGFTGGSGFPQGALFNVGSSNSSTRSSRITNRSVRSKK